MGKGLIHIYTGDGKGKTTSAIGLSIRAKSRNLRALFVQFFKEIDAGNEIPLLNRIGITTIVFEKIKSPFFNPQINRVVLRAEVLNALATIREVLSSNQFDMVVLDEFVCLVSENIMTEEEALVFLRQKPYNLEVVLTGKGATQALIDVADYVTYMQNIKHPFGSNQKARRGIEY